MEDGKGSKDQNVFWMEWGTQIKGCPFKDGEIYINI